MNYLITYQDFDGELIKEYTFTYVEAKAIVEHVLANSCKDASIKPMNDKAKYLMDEMIKFDSFLIGQ